MNKRLMLIALLILTACAQRFYLKSNLNTLSIGRTKADLLAMFPGEQSFGGNGAPGMQIRAAKSADGKLLEVGEVLLTDGVSPTVAYWFLFQDGRLIQWGEPADWNEVKARYEISYSPAVGAAN